MDQTEFFRSIEQSKKEMLIYAVAFSQQMQMAMPSHKLVKLHYIEHVLGKPEIIHLLLEKNINVNERTPLGYTPLHILVLRHIMSYLESLKLLLRNNADINARNDQGCTPTLL